MPYGTTFYVQAYHTGKARTGKKVIQRILDEIDNTWFKSRVTSRRFKLVTVEECARLKQCTVTDLQKHEFERYVPNLTGKWPDGFKKGAIGIDHDHKESCIEIYITCEGDTVKIDFWPLIRSVLKSDPIVKAITLTEYNHLHFEAIGKPEKMTSHLL